MAAQGAAYKIRDLGNGIEWYAGTALYYVGPAVWVTDGLSSVSTDYVIVACSPHAVDHGDKETTIFAAQENGDLLDGYDMGTAELLEPSSRVVGEHDHAKALSRLRDGYVITERKG